MICNTHMYIKRACVRPKSDVSHTCVPFANLPYLLDGDNESSSYHRLNCLRTFYDTLGVYFYGGK